MAFIRKSVRLRQQEKAVIARPDYKGDAQLPVDCTKLCGEYKYIVYADNDQEHMLVFPKTLLHCDVASAHCKNKTLPSAGFVVIGLYETDQCHGLSKSLMDLKSRPEDVELLKTAKFISR